MEVAGELLDGMHVAANGVGAVITAPEFLQHPLSKWGHRKLLSMTETTAPYSPKHARNGVRRASGLVLTHYPDIERLTLTRKDPNDCCANSASIQRCRECGFAFGRVVGYSDAVVASAKTGPKPYSK